MLRKAAAAVGVGCVSGGAYVMSDPKTRRSAEFWSQLGPVVGQYVFTHFHQKYWIKSTPKVRAAAFEDLHEQVNAPFIFRALINYFKLNFGENCLAGV